MENSNDLPISTLKVNFGCTKGCSEDITNMLKQLKGVKSISIDPSEGKVIVVGNVNPMKLIKLLQKIGKKAQLWSFDKEPNNKKACSHATHATHATHKHHSSGCIESSDTEDDSQTDHGYKQRTTQHQKNKKAASHVKHKHKHPSSGCHESSDIEDDSQTDHSYKQTTHQKNKNKKMHDKHHSMFGFGNQHGPPHPPPPYNYQPFPVPGYHNYHPAMYRYQPQHGGYAMPPLMYPGPRPPYPGPYHGPGQPWATHGPYGSMFPSYNPMVHYKSYEDNYRYTI